MGRTSEPRIEGTLQSPPTASRTSATINLSDALPETAEKLLAARRGSRAAMGELFESCRNYLLLVTNTSVRGDLKARFTGSDIVQETFLEASRIFGRFAGDSEEELLRWLTRILEHKLGNAVKKHAQAAKRNVSREVPLQIATGSGVFGPPPVDSGLSPSGVFSKDEESSRIQSAIRQLPADYRRVIELRVHQGLPFEEVGKLMDRSGEAARKLFARAIDEVRMRTSEIDESANPN